MSFQSEFFRVLKYVVREIAKDDGLSKILIFSLFIIIIGNIETISRIHDAISLNLLIGVLVPTGLAVLSLLFVRSKAKEVKEDIDDGSGSSCFVGEPVPFEMPKETDNKLEKFTLNSLYSRISWTRKRLKDEIRDMKRHASFNFVLGVFIIASSFAFIWYSLDGIQDYSTDKNWIL